MPTTNYPKSYIIERIAARRASLDSKRKAAQKDIDDNTAIIVQGQITQANNLQKAYEEAAAKAAAVTIDSHDTKSNAALLNDLSPSNIRVNDPFRYRGYNSQQTPEHTAGEAVTKASHKLAGFDREIDALDHTEAYLRETPVEEFSLTSLKRLGLMEAIKFNLDEAVSKGK